MRDKNNERLNNNIIIIEKLTEKVAKYISAAYRKKLVKELKDCVKKSSEKLLSLLIS